MLQKASQREMTRTSTLPPAVAALDEAVRGISGVLEIEEVLQLIVDRVRDLVGAQYAALGLDQIAHSIDDQLQDLLDLEHAADSTHGLVERSHCRRQG